MKTAKYFLLSFIAFAFLMILASCAAVQKGADILSTSGKISERDKESIVKTSEALRFTFAEITEEEEYYIGRAVAAIILSKYPVLADDSLTKYVNMVGNAVAFHSDRPETYAGYHFLVLDSEEVNALAAPSGFIFVTSGLLARCEDEEMLAAILAHEIGHVSAKHGLQSIKKSRLIDAFHIIGQEAVEKYGPEKLARLTSIFEGVLGDIVETLIERGYDRKYEYEADKLAVAFAARTGYDPHGLLDFLQTMKVTPGGELTKGWFKTHPGVKERIEKAEREIESLGETPLKVEARTRRFNQFRKNAK